MLRPWQAAVALTALLIGLVAYWYLAPREASFGMFEDVSGSGNFRFAVSFVATLVGVVLGSIYRELKSLRAQGIYKIENPALFFSDIARSTDLWLGLAGSPIVYALLLQASDGMSLPGLIVVALQNGFCCLIILNSFVGKEEKRLAE
jgi:hypothetical protein